MDHPVRRRRAAATLCVVLAASVVGLTACGDDAPSPTPSPSSTSGSPSATPSPSVSRPSGLPWDSGVVGHTGSDNAKFATMRGRPIDVLGVSPTRDSWEELFGTWWMGPDTVPADFKGTLNVAMPLFPGDGNLDAAAAGADNENWRRFGALLAKKYPTAYVRPGWEMNIHNWAWSANPGNVEKYKTAFRNAATSLKKGGPHLRIVWNVNEGQGDTLPDAAMAWPGDDVVDIVGIDAYDWSPAYDEKGWETHKTKDQGWDYWGRFAREHGKKFALPEWGVITGNENSGGDNAMYIDKAYSWMQANADIMAFESYFDERADYCKCSLEQNPNAAAAYGQWMKQFG